jgi:hypothetical protein
LLKKELVRTQLGTNPPTSAFVCRCSPWPVCALQLCSHRDTKRLTAPTYVVRRAPPLGSPRSSP